MRDSMVIYRSFVESMRGLPAEDRLALYDAITGYGLDDEQPELSGILHGMFVLMKPQLDANKRKYENGKRGGRPSGVSPGVTEKTKTKPKETKTKPKETNNKPNETKSKPKETKSKPNVNVNDNDNVNVNENAPAEADVLSISKSVLSFLNEETGATWRTDDDFSVFMISRLLQQGYTEDQIKTVIRKKTADWLGDPKVERYLRPATLFGSKFEQYLQQPASAKMKELQENREREEAREEARKSARDQLDACERKLADLRTEYEDAAGNMPLRLDLKEKIAIYEARAEAARAMAGA